MSARRKAIRRVGRRFAGLALVPIVVLSMTPPASAGGLQCSLGELVIENLKIGETYSLLTLAALPLALTNKSEQIQSIQVDPLVPAPGELRGGASPIPDPGWVRAAPKSFDLKPMETGNIELILTLPDDTSLFGRKYQVNIWSHTLGISGNLIAYGLITRLIFSVDEVRETKGIAPHGALSISLLPKDIRLDNLVGGRDYCLDQGSEQPILVRNSSDRVLSVELGAVSPEEAGGGVTVGYEHLLDAATLTLSPGELTLQPGEEQVVSAVLRFPEDRRLSGKQFMCLISATVQDQSVATRICSRVFAHMDDSY